MTREHRPTRSGYPRDLRMDGSSGEVKTHWQPEAFTWYGEEARAKGGYREPFIYLSKSQIRISSEAARTADMKAGDKVQVGVNKRFLAIKKSEAGIPTRPDRGKATTSGLYISASKLIKQLAGDGWPAPGRLPCVFDEQSGMLVARKPGEAAS